MVHCRPVRLVVFVLPLVLFPVAADLAAAFSEDRAVTTVGSRQSPRIPNTSIPFPSTSFPPSTWQPTTTETFPPSTWQPTTTLGDPPMCGDANGDEALTATDALAVLRTAVGISSGCTMQRCDTDANGSVNASDALRVLRKAVGNNVAMNCAV